jgi:uncharacterized membrane protein YsdA (DUF1294 family)
MEHLLFIALVVGWPGIFLLFKMFRKGNKE